MNSTLAYNGQVKIELVKNKKVLKSINCHNEGTAELFRYIANALAGNTNSNSMPKFITMFECKEDYYDIPDHSTGKVIWKDDAKGDNIYGTSAAAMLLSQPYSNIEVKYDPNLQTRDGDGGGYKTEYTFIIPYKQIDQTKDKINVICLYNTKNFGNNITPLAYLRLGNENEFIDGGAVNNSKANLVVTWTMTVCNQIIEE